MSESLGERGFRVIETETEELSVELIGDYTEEEMLHSMRTLIRTRTTKKEPTSATMNPALQRLARSEAPVEGVVAHDEKERVAKLSHEMPMVGNIILTATGGGYLSRSQVADLRAPVLMNGKVHPSPQAMLESTTFFMDYIYQIPSYLTKMGRRITPGEMISMVRSYGTQGYGWFSYAADHKISIKTEAPEWKSSI